MNTAIANAFKAAEKQRDLSGQSPKPKVVTKPKAAILSEDQLAVLRAQHKKFKHHPKLKSWGKFASLSKKAVRENKDIFLEVKKLQTARTELPGEGVSVQSGQLFVYELGTCSFKLLVHGFPRDNRPKGEVAGKMTLSLKFSPDGKVTGCGKFQVKKGISPSAKIKIIPHHGEGMMDPDFLLVSGEVRTQQYFDS